jgi:hypothetical protein
MANVFLYMCEYGTLKPVKVILRMEMSKRRNNGGDEPNQAHCIHIWKCYNKTSVQLIYSNKNIKKKSWHLISVLQGIGNEMSC